LFRLELLDTAAIDRATGFFLPLEYRLSYAVPTGRKNAASAHRAGVP
jgi:hypothetical protein